LLYFDPLYTGKQKEQGQICLTNAGRKFHKDSKRKKNGNWNTNSTFWVLTSIYLKKSLKIP
jgi:hypothetical protein